MTSSGIALWSTAKFELVEAEIQHFLEMSSFACRWEVVHAKISPFRVVTLTPTGTVKANINQ